MSDENKVEEGAGAPAEENKKSGGVFGNMFGGGDNDQDKAPEENTDADQAADEESGDDKKVTKKKASKKKAKKVDSENPLKQVQEDKKAAAAVERTDAKKEVKVGEGKQDLKVAELPKIEKFESLSAYVASKKGAWKTLDPLKKNKWTWINPSKNVIGAMALAAMGMGLHDDDQSKAQVMNDIADEIHKQMTAKPKKESETDSDKE
jgi:hypothetical protein